MILKGYWEAIEWVALYSRRCLSVNVNVNINVNVK